MKVSIVIPTLNEGALLPHTIARCRQARADEILVVDGDSSDGTWDAAANADVRLRAPRGRGPQQNAGAAAADGDVLMFLHADCWPEPSAIDCVKAVLSDETITGGCFRQIIDDHRRRYRMLERGNALRVRWFRLAYGDQGIFLRRNVFEQLGGFPDWPLMEDVELSRRLIGRTVSVSAGSPVLANGGRPNGHSGDSQRFALLPRLLHVHPRRWHKTGVIRQTLRNWRLLARLQLGASVADLAAEYSQDT